MATCSDLKICLKHTNNINTNHEARVKFIWPGLFCGEKRHARI